MSPKAKQNNYFSYVRASNNGVTFESAVEKVIYSSEKKKDKTIGKFYLD